jgi:hypothetical protein
MFYVVDGDYENGCVQEDDMKMDTDKMLALKMDTNRMVSMQMDMDMMLTTKISRSLKQTSQNKCCN